MSFPDASTGWLVGVKGTILKTTTGGIITFANEHVKEYPESFLLSQNYPNPFNPKTIIHYQLSENSFTSLKIYNILGNEIANLVNEKQNAGLYEVEFDGTNFASGVYFYTLQTGSFIETKKLVLLR